MLVSPDRTPQELKTIEDWVLDRRYRAVPGVADDSGSGRHHDAVSGAAGSLSAVLARRHCPSDLPAVAVNNSNAGGGFYSQGGQFYYIRGLGQVKTTEDIGNIVVDRPTTASRLMSRTSPRSRSGTPCGSGSSAIMKNNDAVEGVILMRVGEQAQVVLKRVEELTKELNEHVLPPDIKIVPYYDGAV